jgi:hypothetical protein
LGWTREEYKKIGVKYGFLRRREKNCYPHYINSLDNLVLFRGSFPPIDVHAGSRRTRLLRRTKASPSGMSRYDYRVAITVDFS